jgi:hypothetical protein
MNICCKPLVKTRNKRTGKTARGRGRAVHDGNSMGKVRDMTGLCLLCVGVIGCLAPIIPGLPFMLGAAALLARIIRGSDLG